MKRLIVIQDGMRTLIRAGQRTKAIRTMIARAKRIPGYGGCIAVPAKEAARAVRDMIEMAGAHCEDEIALIEHGPRFRIRLRNRSCVEVAAHEL